MRILVISLLRLGDIIQQEPLFRGLRQKHPGAQLEVLVNEQFLKVQSISPSVDRWHGFPRQHFQSLLAGPAADHWQAFEELQKFFAEKHWSEFDVIYNFTNNFLSAHLMDLLQAPQKWGSQFVDGVKMPAKSLWEDYLNHHLSQNQASRFTVLEIYSKAFQIPLGSRVSRSAAAPNSAALVPLPSTVYLQVLTSDPKKNWGLSRFQQLKGRIEKNPGFKVKILCSSDEKDVIRGYFVDSEIEVLSLAEVKNCLQTARCLVTGDTSIQHLAAEVGCPIVSLFLGSADARKTPPYAQYLRILQASSDCYPCNHSNSCTESRHVCSESIQVEEVLSAVLADPSVESFCVHKSYPEASHFLESSVWRSYLDQSFDREQVIASLSSIRREYLKLYVVRAQDFHSRISDSERRGTSLESWIHVKKSMGREFMDSFAKLDRRVESASELRAVIEIRKKYLTEIINLLRMQNGTRWSERSEGSFAKA